jgi:hypothetical protein
LATTTTSPPPAVVVRASEPPMCAICVCPASSAGRPVVLAISCRSTSRKFWSKIPDSFATYAGKKSARTLLYETTSFALVGCAVDVAGAPAPPVVAAGAGVPVPAHDARTVTATSMVASVFVIGCLPVIRPVASRSPPGRSRG